MRKIILIVVSFSVLILTVIACKKQLTFASGGNVSAITLVNAVINSEPLIASFQPTDSIATYYFTAPQIAFGSASEYSINSGVVPVQIYQYGDTSNTIFQGNFNLMSNGIYSLFLSGANTGQGGVDTLLVVDHPPYHAVTDSTVGVRFVNLVPGSASISIDLQGNAYGSEVTGLTYQGITGFKGYLANSAVSLYNFEFRDSASGALLTTFTYSVSPFQNITIAAIGSEAPSLSSPVTAIQINNF